MTRSPQPVIDLIMAEIARDVPSARPPSTAKNGVSERCTARPRPRPPGRPPPGGHGELGEPADEHRVQASGHRRAARRHDLDAGRRSGPVSASPPSTITRL